VNTDDVKKIYAAELMKHERDKRDHGDVPLKDARVAGRLRRRARDDRNARDQLSS